MLRRLFALLLFMLASPIAHAQWNEASSAHFVVYSRQNPASLKKYAEGLERYDQAMRILRGLPNGAIPPATRVIVYVLDDQGDIATLYGRSNVGGFYIARATGAVAFVPRRGNLDSDLDAQSILFHEYAHHMMLSVFQGAFPTWLVEGWAEFHATATIEGDGSVSFGRAPQYRVGAYGSMGRLPLAGILSGNLGKLGGDELNMLYARSWAMMHYFTFDPTRGKQLVAYIQGINTGKPAGEAAKEAFGDIGALDRDINRYIMRPYVRVRTVSGSAIKTGEISVRQLTPGETATMMIRIRSDRGGRTPEGAAEIYADAKAAAAPFPNDPGAQMALAEAAYDAKDYDAALAAADRALAVNPRALPALTYRVMAQMALARAKGDRTPATWGAIRRTIIAANRIDQDYPMILMLYYRSFTEADMPPTSTAKDGLYRAFMLVPQDNWLRLEVAQMYIGDGQPQVARVLLLPLVYSPHAGALAEVAQKLIAQIDAGTAQPAKP